MPDNFSPVKVVYITHLMDERFVGEPTILANLYNPNISDRPKPGIYNSVYWFESMHGEPETMSGLPGRSALR